MAEPTFDRFLDAKGVLCPMPVVRCREALQDLRAGQVLKIEASDPGSKADIPAFCRQTGHELVTTVDGGEVYTYFIRKR